MEHAIAPGFRHAERLSRYLDWLTKRSPMNEILVDHDGYIATVTLNRPEKRNAFTLEHLAEIDRVFAELSADTGVRVIVLTGAGSAFSAGGDVGILRQGGAAPGKPRPERWDAVRQGSQHTIETILRARPVTISAINGPCAGGGLALACATDLRYASDTAIFTTAFAMVGQTGDMGLPWSLTKIVGSARARELMFLSEIIDADEALRLGLVNKVVPADDLAACVGKVAARLTSMAPLALAGMKRNLDDAQDQGGLSEYLGSEVDRYLDNIATQDATEAAAAFLEKRNPVYAGR
jgi:2-(1,2-epoxy-1,2-dihydrophenyl)acetyl-CoA isomerase